MQTDVKRLMDRLSVRSEASDGHGAVVDREQQAVLALVDNCVRAMQMLDARMADLESKARRAVEDSVHERNESRADIATLRTRTKLTDSNIDQFQIRLAAIETAAAETHVAHRRDLAAARSDVDQWRQRADGAVARMTAVEDRLTQAETGLERRLRETESELSDARSQAARMEQRAALSEASADQMQGRLSEAVSAVADQRARIACLQAKLGAATQAARYADETQAMADPHRVTAESVIDLRGLAETLRTSAA